MIQCIAVIIFIRLYFVSIPHCRRHVAFYTLAKRIWVIHARYSCLEPNSYKLGRQTREIKTILRERSCPGILQKLPESPKRQHSYFKLYSKFRFAAAIIMLYEFQYFCTGKTDSCFLLFAKINFVVSGQK